MPNSFRNSDPTPPIMQGSPPPPEWRVPRDDWDRPPWNRWAFQNVRSFLPTAAVRRGSGPVWALEEAPADIGAIAFQTVSGETTSVDDMLDATYTDGFLVMIGGRIVAERYFNGMEPHTPHLCQSVSKSITATAAAPLIARGLLDPAAPVTDVLPELAETAWKGATLQHVMDMTSGVRFGEEYTDAASDIGKTDVASGWKPIPRDAPPDVDWPACIWDQILSLRTREAEHGARWSYRSIETDVLAHAMMRVTGLSLAEIVSRELWQPMGAQEDAYFTIDSAGYCLADGGFNATLRDLARFGQVYLSGGRRDAVQIIPEAFVTDIRSGEHGLFDDAGREHLANGWYRNQFWIEDRTRQTALCLGVFGQLVYISPEYDMVAVKLSTWPDFIDSAHTSNTLRALHAIAADHGRSA